MVISVSLTCPQCVYSVSATCPSMSDTCPEHVRFKFISHTCWTPVSHLQRGSKEAVEQTKGAKPSASK
ncbi:hypothetical protein CsSME_00000046 [Camellia sinensis var. sinensis]